MTFGTHNPKHIGCEPADGREATNVFRAKFFWKGSGETFSFKKRFPRRR